MTLHKIMISAGEVSGDVHGAKLVSELKKIDPTLQFFGMGSERMAKEGVHLFADLTTVSTIGMVEPIQHIPKIYLTYLKMKRLMKTEKPDLLIVIDYQGYHMMLIKAAKKMGIPVVYYIAPQEWQWGTEAGGRQVVRYTDKILSIYPEEADFYNRLGGNAVYIGHPILDLAVPTLSRTDFLTQYGIPDKRILSIFPGSRPQELALTYPILLKSAQIIQNKIPDLQIVISIAAPQFKSQIISQANASGLSNIIFYEGLSYNLIAQTTLSLVSAGTITLEHACLGTPSIANYRFGKFSYWIAKKLFAKKIQRIKYMALPSLIMDRLIQPEFLQEACTPENIALAGITLLTNPAQYQALKNDLLSVKTKLGFSGIVAKAATEIHNFI